MPNPMNLGSPIVLDPPKKRRRIGGYLLMLAAVLSVGGAAWAWESGYRPPFLAAIARSRLALLEVDQGDVLEFIAENGTLESATNTVVRCEVEALMGMVGGSTGSGGAAGTGNRSGTTGSSTSGQSGTGTHPDQGTGGSTGGHGRQRRGQRRGHGQGQVEGRGDQEGRKRELQVELRFLRLRSSSSSSSVARGRGQLLVEHRDPPRSAVSGTGTTRASRSIRSFTYVVTPHMPLRGAATKSTTTTRERDQIGHQADQAAVAVAAVATVAVAAEEVAAGEVAAVAVAA